MQLCQLLSKLEAAKFKKAMLDKEKYTSYINPQHFPSSITIDQLKQMADRDGRKGQFFISLLS